MQNLMFYSENTNKESIKEIAKEVVVLFLKVNTSKERHSVQTCHQNSHSGNHHTHAKGFTLATNTG